MSHKTIILHVGLHKTASSSIQRTLASHRLQLRAGGYDYATLTNFKGEDHINHSLPLFVAFSENYRQYTYLVAHGLDPEAERQRFREALLAVVRAADTVRRGNVQPLERGDRALARVF